MSVDFEERNPGWLEKTARREECLRIESEALNEAGFSTSNEKVTGREYRFFWGKDKVERGRVTNFSVDGAALRVYVSAQFLGDTYLLYFTRTTGKWVAYVKSTQWQPNDGEYVEGDFELM